MLTIAGGIILAVVLITVFRAVGTTFIVLMTIALYAGSDYLYLIWEMSPEEMLITLCVFVGALTLIENALKSSMGRKAPTQPAGER